MFGMAVPTRHARITEVAHTELKRSLQRPFYRTLTAAGGSRTVHAVPARHAERLRQSQSSPQTLHVRGSFSSARRRPTTRPAAGAVLEEQGATVQDAPGSFSWARQWWPLGVVSDLDMQDSHSLQLLGTRLLLWRRTPTGGWTAFQDRCPHRGSPLSSGQVTAEGRVECPAHAWQFDADGACTKIPQIKDPQQHNEAISAPSACAVVYPTAEVDGLLWVWGEGSPAAQKRAPLAPPPSLASINTRTGELAVEGTHWFCRDLPLQWATMLEGALDSSRFKDQRTMALEVVLRPGEAGGMVVADFATPIGPYTGEFHPPGMVRYDYGPQFHAVIHVTPTSPGQCRWIMATWSAGDATSDFLKRYRRLESDPLLNHMQLRNKTLDFDLTVLKVMEEGIAQAHDRPLYEPASADLLPAAFRAWLQSVGGPPPSIAAAPEDTVRKLRALSERQLLDRLEQHVRKCSTCSQALKQLQGSLQLVNVLLPIAGALAVLAFALHPLLPLPLAAVAGALAYWRQRLLGQREWFEYVPPVAGKAFEFP